MKEFYRKNAIPLFALFLIPLFIASLFSCSMLEADSPSSSVSFTFSGEFVQSVRGGVFSRAALGESGTENLSVEISLSGSYTATKTASLSEGTTVTFSEIPVGSKIKANGQIYSVLEESEKEILYTGESEEITIREGENRLALKMKKAESESEEPEPEEPVIEEITYTVTFDVDGGSAVASQTVAEGEILADVEYPVKSDYVFSGWYTDSNCTEKFDLETAVTADLTLYAKWQTPQSIALTYDSFSTTAEKNEFGDDYLPSKLFDSSSSTKWCINITVDSSGVIEGGISVIFHAANSCLITKYSLTPGNDTSDFPNRNPKVWQLLGSDSLDGAFTEIQTHSATDTALSTSQTEQSFECTTTKPYKYYKFVVNQLSGGIDSYGGGMGTLQLDALALYGAEL